MKNEKTRKRFAWAVKRNPVRTSCPLCGTKNLLNVFPDQFCTKCDWDTVIAYVESGRMHDLNQAYFEHFIMPKIEARSSAPEIEENSMGELNKAGVL